MPSYKHLTSCERDQIAALRAAGADAGAIADALGRHRSTIVRELKRNALPGGGYTSRHADGAYLLRRQRDAVLEQDEKLRLFVIQRLSEGWSPEQVAGWLKTGGERALRSVCTETIYAFIYRASQMGAELWRYLTRRRKHRRPLRARAARDLIKHRTSIHDRPQEIENRSEFGHWEGDLLICKRNKPVLVLHERKSRLTLAARLTGKSAAETVSSMLAILARFDADWRKSIAFDNGTEFALHDLLRSLLGMTTWFCDAYASWQKGGVENANGRLRRWLPRQLDIDQLTDAELQDIVINYNLTPRKCLAYQTPLQALFKAKGKEIKLNFA